MRNKMAEWRPVSLFQIYFNIKGISLKQQMTFENSTKNLEDLRMLAQERDVWKDSLNVICSA